MTTTFKAHFDGRMIVPDQPVDLPTGEAFTVHVEARAKATTLGQMLELASTVGFDSASLAEMSGAIDEDCERVDPNGW